MFLKVLIFLVHSLNIRSNDSIFNNNFFNNKFLLVSFIFGAIIQISVTLIPSIAKMFEVTSLNIFQWIYTILISISPIFIMELKKKLHEIRHGKIVYSFSTKKA